MFNVRAFTSRAFNICYADGNLTRRDGKLLYATHDVPLRGISTYPVTFVIEKPSNKMQVEPQSNLMEKTYKFKLIIDNTSVVL